MEILCNWKFCTNTTCSNLAQPPHLACCLVPSATRFYYLGSELPFLPLVGNPPDLEEARGWRASGSAGQSLKSCSLAMQSLGAPRSQEAPGQALRGRGVPCLSEEMRSASLLEINKSRRGGAVGVMSCKGLRMGLGAVSSQKIGSEMGDMASPKHL